jgi:ribose 5-phosphate isomerase B
MIKIGLASDHAGFELKEFVKSYIEQKGYTTIDFGCYSAESCDYPDFAHPLAKAVEAGKAGDPESSSGGEAGDSYGLTVLRSYGLSKDLPGVDMGIALCGSGNGIAMTLNKHPGIRAAICWSADIARITRAHNDANILVLPARFINRQEAAAMIDIFLNIPFEGGRHQRRIEKIGTTQPFQG